MKNITVYGLLVIGVLVAMSLFIGTSSAVTLAFNSQPSFAQNESTSIFTAIVAVRSASGKSYMADRNGIATMPELKTIEDMRAFIAQYEPSPQDAAMVRMYFENQGLTIVAQDNLFLIVSGTQQQFDLALGSMGLISRKLKEDVGDLTIQDVELQTGHAQELSLIDGIIITKPTSGDVLPQSISSSSAPVGCDPDSFSLDEVAHLLRVDNLHQSGLTGKGVKIAFADSGVDIAHSYFYGRPIKIYFYEVSSNGKVDDVYRNFDPSTDNGHGTMVASILSAFAKDSIFFSFALRPDEQDHISPSTLVSILAYIKKYGVADVFSLSQAVWEEMPGSEIVASDVRVEMINFMSVGNIVLVGSGNTKQAMGDYDSGHNALAAIPEVIAVGGADIGSKLSPYNYSASGGYGRLVYEYTGAASFDSILFSGRHVPDVVGLFGPDICHPHPGKKLDKFTTGPIGTSGATPQIAGIVALLKQRNPSLTQPQIRYILQNNAWDIIQGESGDGDPAGVGYDPATGYGLPLASWAIQDSVVLRPGWNVLSLTKTHTGEYTALNLLQEINASRFRCFNVTHWPTNKGKYEGIQIDPDGTLYGFDFPLSLGEGFFLGCNGPESYWQPSGVKYVDTVQTLHFKEGFNLFSVPYSNVTCTAKDIWKETGNTCWRVYKFDGQWSEIGNTPTAKFGRNFPLSSGEGYGVVCNADIDWTPSCEGSFLTKDTLPSSINTFTPGLVTDSHLLSLIANSRQTISESESAVACSPQNVTLSNVSDQRFSVSWSTTEPCMGSVVINNGSNPIFQAFDDRGLRFSGTTHHVSIQGLEANTTYSFGLLSGDIWDDQNGLFYRVVTGAGLPGISQSSNVHGQVINHGAETAQDAIVYVRLENHSVSPNTYSALLSFPLDEYVDGYAINLNNARADDGGSFFNNTSVTHLSLKANGGSAGEVSTILPVDLMVTQIVTATALSLPNIAPEKPTLTEPASGIVVLQPTFRFSAIDASGNSLTYRLEISKDNFASIAETFDSRNSADGWSDSSFLSGEEAQFKIPHSLENLLAYQWRVFAYNGNTWSKASDIAVFSIKRYGTVFMPLILRNFRSDIAPAPTSTPQPSVTPRNTPIPTSTPNIPPPDMSKWQDTFSNAEKLSSQFQTKVLNDSLQLSFPDSVTTFAESQAMEEHPEYIGDPCVDFWDVQSWGRGGHTYVTLNAQSIGESTNWGIFRPSLSHQGLYQVDAWIPNHYAYQFPCTSYIPGSDTENAAYEVHYISGVTTIYGVQSTLRDEWLHLGSFTFGAGTDGYVNLSDLTGEPFASHYVVFDDLSFTLVEMDGWVMSEDIALPSGKQWSSVSFFRSEPSGTHVWIDVMTTDSATVLLENVQSGASLTSIDSNTYSVIRLRARFKSSALISSAKLDWWSVAWMQP